MSSKKDCSQRETIANITDSEYSSDDDGSENSRENHRETIKRIQNKGK